jgi:HD-GYP domain-containing protein (c-di-GMP phosphodiesterase class II)
MRGAQDASPLDRAALLSLATSLGHAEYFEELRRALQARFQAMFVAIAVADGARIARFRTVFAFGGSEGGEPPAISPGLFARACDSRGAVIVTADGVDAAHLPASCGSMAVAPMGATGRRFGALAIASPDPRTFDGNAVEDVAAAADITALVVGALVAADTARARGEELTLLLDATRALSTERDLKKLFEQFHALVASVMDAQSFLIALGSVATGRMQFPFAVTQGAPLEIPEAPFGDSLCGHVFTNGKPLLFRRPEDFAAYPDQLAGEGDATVAAVFVPMKVNERTIGVISVQSEHECAYTERDLELLVAIAEQGAIAVENSQYLLRAEHRARELKLLAEVSRALSAQLSLKALCQTVCGEVRRVMDAPVFLVSLTTPDRLTMHVEYCAQGDDILDLPDYPIAGTLAEKVVQSNQAVVVQTRGELSENPHQVIKADDRAVQSLAMAPLRLADQCIGVMTAQSYADGAYDESAVRLLGAIAEQMALAVQNAQLFREAQNRADRDPLTNLYHHRYLKTRLDEELARARTDKSELSLLMLTAVLHATCRSADVIGRYGGDEFMVILPATPPDRALVIGARIRDAVGDRQLRLPGGASVPLRASIGLSSCPVDGTTSAELIAKADAGLYQSKRHGRPSAALQRIGTMELRLEGNFGPVAELLAALLIRDPDSRTRLENVNHLAKDTATAFSLPQPQADALLLASVLRDVGKIAIPDHVLRKAGPLSPPEYELVKRHATIGAMLVENIPGFDLVAGAVRHHHERFDGSGYPSGLSGSAIPLIARLLTLLDSFSALTSDRPHKRRVSAAVACAELKRGAGTQFDPELVERFVEVAAVARR